MTDIAAKKINGDLLAQALISGIHRVIGQQELLNRINVFPVADSDTGTNLSLSLGAALAVLGDPAEKHLGTMLAAVADTLLDSARGNSGAIIAQFFQGMSDSAGEITQFTPYTFSNSVSQGATYAYDALSKPREGTILSVIAAFAEQLAHQVAIDENASLANVLADARRSVEVALANTPNQLEVLQRAGVVDAGAKGFAELVGGISDFLTTGDIAPMPDTAHLHEMDDPISFSASDNESPFRYCTECLVTGADIHRRKLREALSEIGDSLVLAGSKRKAKIHIHVDDPDSVFDIARKFGTLSGAKAEDMHLQQHTAQDRSKRFAVITDSAADISDEDMERLDIHMVPCRIQFGDRGYLDKVSITSQEFFAKLENDSNHPTTSQPAPGDFRRQFQFLASHFNDVLSINLSSMTSGTYESALSAANRINARGQVHVVDSRNASMGQGQLVVFAAECAEAGLSVGDTLSLINDSIPNVKTYVLLKDLRYALRGGRLPQWVETITDLFCLTPIVNIRRSGSIGLGGFIFGRRNRIRKFASFIAMCTIGKSALELGIGHAICADDAEQLATILRQKMPAVTKLTLCDLGTALGVHGGPGTLIVSTRPISSTNNITIDVN